MSFLSEDATFLAGFLGIAALGCLIALKVTQQGKFLLWAIGLGLLAGAALGIEHYWVTENERIEAVIVEMGRAAANSDTDRVMALFTPDATIEYGAIKFSGPLARSFVASNLGMTKFDFLHVSRIEPDAGLRTMRGTAQFQVLASGTWGHYNFATGPNGTEWSAGFEQTADGEWKINRLTATRLPSGFGQAFGQRH